MSKEVNSKSFGISTSVKIDDAVVDIACQYDENSFAINATGTKLDLASIAKERLNGLNVVLPEGSSIPIVALSGKIEKTGDEKQNRQISINGSVENITLPIPMLSDLTINKAYLFYDYLSVAPTGKDKPNYSGQSVAVGCDISLSGDLSKAVKDATITGAYFISNDATITYLNFAGTINVGNVLTSIFGGTFPNLSIDVESAGLFRITKQNTVESKKGSGKKPTVQGITYQEALAQMAQLQPNAATPTGKTGALMPPSFPLSNMPTDFSTQFAAAFDSQDPDTNITGICFWTVIDFDQIDLFKSMITVGYSGQMNNLTMYGYRTQVTKKKEPQPQTNSALFASIPPFQLIDIFAFSGSKGRTNILFKYTSNKNQYELSGAVEFTPFGTDKGDPHLTFDGDLTVNDTKMIGDLTISTSSVSSSVDAPFGMTGINFGELKLSVDHTFAQTKPTKVLASTDLVIQGTIDLTAIEHNLLLKGTIVFEKSEPRLALVSLTANPALTIYDFVSKVLSSRWNWVDDITKSIGFISGSMYYLKCPKSYTTDQCKTYTFDYTDTEIISSEGGDVKEQTPTPTTYKQGYHVDAVLQFFEKYNFEIELDVEQDGINLSGSYAGTTDNPSTTLTEYFVSLTSPKLSINTTSGQSKFEVSVDNLELFGTSIGNLSMGYSDGIFSGSYTRNQSPQVGVYWQWTKGDFSITKIDNLGSQEVQNVQAIASIVKQLNNLGSGSCGTIVNSMFNNAVKVSFSLSMTQGKKPSELPGGKMNVPVTVDVDLTVMGQNITTIPVSFEVEITIPTSLEGLPAAIWSTVTDSNNLDKIFGEIISNKGTYEAIALVVAKKLSASVAAKILCKTQDEELAEELSEAIEGGEIVADAAGGLGAVLELQVVVVGIVAFSAANAVGNFLSEIWDTIKSWFTGGDSKKEKAEKQVNDMINSVKPLLTNIKNQLSNVSKKIEIDALTVGVNSSGQFEVDWDFVNNVKLEQNTVLKYELKFLEGAVGSSSDVQPGLPNKGFVVMQPSPYLDSWSTMLSEAPGYQMNASIQTTITGYTFMTPQTKEHLNSIISKLNSIVGDVDSGTANNIHSFISTTQSFITEMDTYNKNGLTSSVVFAQLREGKKFEVGTSALGINTYL